MSSRIFLLANAWASHPDRTVAQMGPLRPFFRVLLHWLYALPPRLHYRGFGLRVVRVDRVPTLERAFREFREVFAVGRPVNFYSFASFGVDGAALEAFTGSLWRRVCSWFAVLWGA
eukprot:RCo041952